jgi:hypothetical protein
MVLAEFNVRLIIYQPYTWCSDNLRLTEFQVNLKLPIPQDDPLSVHSLSYGLSALS